MFSKFTSFHFYIAGNYSVDILENVASGTSVFQVTATDADGGINGVILFSLSTHSKFTVEPNTGKIFLVDYLDRETESQYTLTAYATDLGSPAKTTSATILVTVVDVDDNLPVIVPKSHSLFLSENIASGSVVHILNVSDPDEGDNSDFNCFLFSGNIDNAFGIQTDVSVNECKLVVNSLDYEIYTSLQLIVRASVAAGEASEAFVHVQVLSYNEFPPVFIPVSFSEEVFVENSPIGSKVANLTATDEDAGADGEVTYSLLQSSAFTADPNTGEVISTRILDAERETRHVLTVLAVDGGSDPERRTATYTLTINIGNLNDVAPVCTKSSYNLSVPETLPWPMMSLANFSCTDLDVATPNNDLVFTITNATVGGIFGVNPDVGNFYILPHVANLDWESTPSYEVTITVSDGGTPPLTTTISVTVHVTGMYWKI